MSSYFVAKLPVLDITELTGYSGIQNSYLLNLYLIIIRSDISFEHYTASNWSRRQIHLVVMVKTATTAIKETERWGIQTTATCQCQWRSASRHLSTLVQWSLLKLAKREIFHIMVGFLNFVA